MNITDKILKLFLNESLKENDVVYISTANWQNIWSGNRGLHRFPSDEIVEKLKPIYTNKSLGTITKDTGNGYNVKFDDQTFFLKPEYISLLSGKKTA
jgi:hypothetical protein